MHPRHLPKPWAVAARLLANASPRTQGAPRNRSAWALAAVAALALSGCVESDDGIAENLDSPDSMDTSAFDQTVPGAGGAPATTWFLHVDLACTEPPCNCGSAASTMDQERRDGECPVQGGRSPLSPVVSPCAGKECFHATTDFPRYPAGTSVEGVLFMTSDLPEEVVVTIALLDGHAQLGTTEVDAVLRGTPLSQIDDEWVWTEVPVSFVLERGIRTGGGIVLEVSVDYTWSFFIGNTADHPSGFTIGGPHPIEPTST